MSDTPPEHEPLDFSDWLPREITDPEEIEREKALRLRDNGTGMIVDNVLGSIEDGKERGRNLLDVMVQLSAYLTPEQQIGFAQRLPDLLSPAARAVLTEQLASSLPPPGNEKPRAEAG